MFFTRSNRLVGLVFGALLGTLASASPVLAADMIEVKNTSGITRILSDLIVYGPNGQKLVVLKPGDPSDDIAIKGGESKIFGPFDFEVERYFISSQIGTSEIETLVLEVKPLVPRKLAFVQDLKTGFPVVLGLDDQLATYEPQLGDKLSFRNGMSPQKPGVIAAHQPDFDNGWLLGQYTGRCMVVSAELEATVIPLNGPGGDR